MPHGPGIRHLPFTSADFTIPPGPTPSPLFHEAFLMTLTLPAPLGPRSSDFALL